MGWGGGLTFIGVGDKLVCQGGGKAWIVQAGVPEYEAPMTNYVRS